MALFGAQAGAQDQAPLLSALDHGISAGRFKAVQLIEPGSNANTNLVVVPQELVNDLRPVKADDVTLTDGTVIKWWNVGDVYVQAGASSADDVENGILISSVAQNGPRNNGFANVSNYYASSFIAASTLYRICTHTPRQVGKAGDTAECNVDVAAAWFPYSKYLGGLARNASNANGGSNDLLIASPQLVNGVHFINFGVTNELAASGGWLTNDGKSIVDLRSFGIDSRKDGVLLVNGGKDEGNFALSKPLEDGTWMLYVHDISTGTASNYEQDPVAFVYIPRNAPGLISGKFNGDASIAIHSGNTPQFTVDNIGAGRWHLEMNDYASTNGVLIISPEGGGTYNLDNIVSYSIDGRGWQIQSRDTPNNGLQTPYGVVNGQAIPEPVCSFVFIPANPVGFAVTPSANLLTTEAGGTATFTVGLNTAPTDAVTINVSSSDPTEGLANVNSLTFYPTNWWEPQTVTVTGVDDGEKDGQVAYSIILSAAVSGDARYSGLKPADVGALNIDDEPGSIWVSANQLTTTEAGGADSFMVVLNSEPTAEVTIALSSTDLTEGTVSPSSITFTPPNRTNVVTVTGVDDAVRDGNVAYTIALGAAVSADLDFNGVKPLDVNAVNWDNDTADLVVSPGTALTVSEAGTTASFTVALAAPPTADVTVSFVSSDATEGAVSPASRTFTAGNWSTPQTFTLTGVDDLVADGTVAYTLEGTASSSDVGYDGLTWVIQASTTDNEAQLELPSGTVYYGAGLPGLGIDGSAVVTDPFHANYASGSLTVALTSGAASNDRLEIRNIGMGPGEIGVSGADVSYGGMKIGTFAGGAGATPLVITFNVSATPEAAQALLRNVTYRSVASTPLLAPRAVTVTLADGLGGVSVAGKVIEVSKLHVSDFQEGKDAGFGAYTGQKDLEIFKTAPGTPYPQGSSPDGLVLAWSKNEIIGPDHQVLLRFDNIVGTDPGQIPPGATIVSADLVLAISNSGDGSPMARMLIPWDPDYDSWDAFGDGVQLDGIEADNSSFTLNASWPRFEGDTSKQLVQIGVADLSGSTGLGAGLTVSVLPDVQYWVNGGDNHGWVMPGWTTNIDNTMFRPSEYTNLVERPRLVVKWLPPGATMASFQQGVEGYTGTVDTRIRQAAPSTTYATINGLFPDFEVTAGLEDKEQAFLRFDNIIGTAAGQIPPGAKIHAAVVDFGNILANSTGDGGTMHRMLIPWQDTTATWNSFVDGLQADDVEAVAKPTAEVGYVELEPNVSGGWITADVTLDVQLWANGAANYGWGILPWPYGGDGWGFATAEHTWVASRPHLRVYYTALYMLPPTVGATSVEVKFIGDVGKTYTVVRSADVSLPMDQWTVLGPAVVDESGTGAFTDSNKLPGQAFYRVRE